MFIQISSRGYFRKLQFVCLHSWLKRSSGYVSVIITAFYFIQVSLYGKNILLVYDVLALIYNQDQVG